MKFLFFFLLGMNLSLAGVWKGPTSDRIEIAVSMKKTQSTFVYFNNTSSIAVLYDNFSPNDECSMDPLSKAPIAPQTEASIVIHCKFTNSSGSNRIKNFVIKDNNGLTQKFQISATVYSPEVLKDEAIELVSNAFFTNLSCVVTYPNTLVNGCSETDSCKINVKDENLNGIREPILKVDAAFTAGYKSGLLNDRLSEVETVLNEAYPRPMYYAGYLGKIAQDKEFALFKTSHEMLTKSDAFRHTYWNALMAKHINPDFAKLMTTAHEIKTFGAAQDFKSNPEHFMDLINNHIGRTIGEKYKDKTDEELAQIVLKTLNEGKLYKVANGELVPTP